MPLNDTRDSRTVTSDAGQNGIVDWATWVSKCYPELVLAASPYVGSAVTAEDIVQEALMVALSCQETEIACPRAWLRGVVKNVGRSMTRKRTRRAKLLREHSGVAVPTNSDVFSPIDGRGSQVLRLANRLPDTQRRIVAAMILEGSSDRELAKILEIPRGTIRVYRHRAIASLKKMLNRADSGLRCSRDPGE